MTARVVITSTVHSIHGGKHHAESIIPGVPICGAPLRNWTRAVAVDDRGLCASCWPAIPLVQTFDMGPMRGRIAGRNSDPAVAQTATGSTHSLSKQRAGFDEA